ncbi:MAG: ABC transporter permease [Candidatus Tectimicrobiota bacterium]
MYVIALQMLLANRAKYAGMILALTFASLLITQQMSIFLGILARSYSFITDAGLADIWVMDPRVQFIDDLRPLREISVLRVRRVPGVQWAVPLYKGLLKVRLSDGTFQTVNLIGLDDASLIGGPAEMRSGRLDSLHQPQAIIVDEIGAADKLARQLPDGRFVPLQVGDTVEVNDHRAVVVGICRVGRTFQSQPVIYTTYARATAFAPLERKRLSFVLVSVRPGENVAQVAARIRQETGLAAYPREAFKRLTASYLLQYTGIAINFGIAVSLGFLVGTAVAGQTFYSFMLDNLRHFAMLKAMGTTSPMLLRMVLLQALWVGGIGYGLGVGLAALAGHILRHTQLAFSMPWPLLGLSAAAILLICLLSAAASVVKVLRLEPVTVFQSA